MAKKEPIKRKVWKIDAENKVLGRMATEIALLLRGKHKVSFEAYKDEGDIVYVENANKVRVTGQKGEKKIYYHYSGYPGGMKAEKFDDLRVRFPEKIIKLAVWRMLPKNKLRSQMIKRLHISRSK